MLNKKPLVSVLMTAYNREQFIAEAIESVLGSTYQNWELIIVDDGSKDNTVTIAKSYATKDERITVYINEKNLGDYPNRNRAVSYAKGEYIMFCDSDDILFPETISKVLNEVNKWTDFNFGMYWPHSSETFMLEGHEALKRHFFEIQFLYMGPGSTVIRRSYLQKINGYPEKYGPANDMYFNLKACCYSSILLLPFEFMYYRRHEGQEVNNRASYLYNNYLYMRDALAELPLPFSAKKISWLKKKNKRRFVVHLFNLLVKTKNLKGARFAYKKAEFTLKDIIHGILH